MSDRDKLQKIVERRIRTAFIAAIYEFECEFADLMGGRMDENDTLCVDEDQLNDAQRDLYDRYLAFRAKTLRKGNNQIKMLSTEIKSFTVEWNGTEMVFKPM